MRTTRFLRALAREGAGRRGDARWETREPARLTAISPVRRHEVWRRDVGRVMTNASAKKSLVSVSACKIAKLPGGALLARPARTVHAIARFIEAHGDDPTARHRCGEGYSAEPTPNPLCPPRTPPRLVTAKTKTNTTAHGNFPVQQDLAAMRQERQTALKETAELQGLNGGGGAPLARLAEIPRAARRERWPPRRGARRRALRRGGARKREATPRLCQRRGRARRQPARGKTRDRWQGGREREAGETSRTGPKADAPTSRDDSTMPTHPDASWTAARWGRLGGRKLRLTRSPAESAHIRVVSYPDDPDDASESAHSCPLAITT